jgi:hypothetical protein
MKQLKDYRKWYRRNKVKVSKVEAEIPSNNMDRFEQNCDPEWTVLQFKFYEEPDKEVVEVDDFEGMFSEYWKCRWY